LAHGAFGIARCAWRKIARIQYATGLAQWLNLLRGGKYATKYGTSISFCVVEDIDYGILPKAITAFRRA
jgi:hypothetical protein